MKNNANIAINGSNIVDQDMIISVLNGITIRMKLIMSDSYNENDIAVKIAEYLSSNGISMKVAVVINQKNEELLLQLVLAESDVSPMINLLSTCVEVDDNI